MNPFRDVIWKADPLATCGNCDYSCLLKPDDSKVLCLMSESFVDRYNPAKYWRCYCGPGFEVPARKGKIDGRDGK